ncbi:MAG: asparagine synthase (glutamine-hydrolyzing) [Gemmatimonadales bacterium]
MCGLAGMARVGGPLDARVVKAMTDVVSYRGPDDEGFGCWGAVDHAGALPTGKTISSNSGGPLGSGGVVLGFRRLSIIDLSAVGHQPMGSADGRYWLVFNGEVYNYLELRAELHARGAVFRTSTDTEVILAAFAEWGPGCLGRFNGMWGLAIYDAVEGVLFVARDRFGVKPFYYAIAGDRFGFASEIKQLHVAGMGTGRADRGEVARFLLYGEVNLSERTCVEGVRQLQPGHAIRWRIADGVAAIRPERWYDPARTTAMRPDGRLADYQHEFTALLHDAVQLRLRSDVPVGSCLSGGLDSSTIVLLANGLLRQRSPDGRQHTFTSCFADPRFDEWDFAAQIVASAGVEPHRVFPDLRCLWEEMPQLAWHQDEPFRTTSIYAQWNVMRLARESGVTVLLDGQGADEAMPGYHTFIPLYLAGLVRSGQPARAWRELNLMRSTGLLSATEPATRTLSKMLYHSLGLTGLRGRRLAGMIRPEFAVARARSVPAGFQETIHDDLFGSLQSLLRHEDRNSMAFSIEARTPFLDYRLVELFLRMPGAYKLRDGWTKPFLREAMRGVMPEPVRLRVDKKGFVTPESEWYRTDGERMKATLLDPASPVTEWVEPSPLREFLGREGWSRDGAAWRLLSVHFWMTRFGLA